MKNKKLIITLSIIAILVLTIGITYSIFTSSRTSKNSNLVVGDIYMHYNETNQIQMENAMPTNPYVANPIMATQEYEDNRNELSKCVIYFNKYKPNEGETALDFCKGTGTYFGDTLQILLDNNRFNDDMLTELKELNIITNDNKVNPIMATQEYTEGGTNELSKCVDAFVNVGREFDEGLYYCKDNSSRIIEMLENGFLDYLNLADTFIQENIIIFNPTIPYFEFTIDGKNTTIDKDIWYEIVLTKGDDQTGKTRIKDNLLRFRLTETKDNKETEIFTDKSYDDLTNKRIWVDTINKNTTSEVVHTYRLYMWISNDTVIGNVNQDYTMEEWKNIFASIKVGVSGDFNEKYIIPETSCFETEENETGLTITYYSSSCGSKIVIPATIDDKKITKIGSNSFLNKNLLSVSISSNITIIDDNAFANNQLTNIEIPSSVTTIGGGAFANNLLTNIEIPSSVTTIESGTFDNNKISNVNINTSITSIGAYAFTNNNIQDLIVPDTVTKLHCKSFDDGVVNNRDMTCRETNASCFTTYTNNDDTISIIDYDNTCDKDVIIPKTINNKNVTTIEQEAFYNNQLTSVIIPDTVTNIKKYAFANNNIFSVIIPNSVVFLHCYAFDYQFLITKPDNLVCRAPIE